MAYLNIFVLFFYEILIISRGMKWIKNVVIGI